MRLPRNLCAGVRALLKKRGCDAELDEELRGFLESVQLKKMQSGLSGNEALREARMEMGSIESVKEGVRSAGWETMVETLWQDLRYGLRMLRKSPGFTAVAVLTLALGIGANTAIFSVVNAVLLKSLPFRDAGQLVAISEAHPNIAEIGAPTADLRDWRAQSRSFEDLAAYSHHGFWNATMMVHGEPEEVHGSIVTHNLFPLLGIVPAIGRNFLGEEDALGRGAVAILSGEIWKTRFGGDPKIIGQPLVLDGKNFTVVGVLPAGIRFPGDVDVWVPLANMAKDDLTSRYYHALFVVGRLRPGVTVSEAGIEMAGIGERLSRAYPNTNRNIGVKVEALQDEYVAGLRSALIVLWCAVGLVLLIACANVASLLLARAASREGEMAVRSALGASRARLIRQGLTESIVLAGIGGLLGLALAWASLPLFSQWLPRILDAPILHVHSISVDPRVLTATLGISITVGILFGLLPAIRMSRGGANAALRPGGRTSASVHRRRTHRVLAAVEVALAVIVLIGAGLLARSLQQLLATSPGFRTDHLLTMRISLPKNKYNSQPLVDGFYRRLLPALRALPGVESASTIDQTPLVPNTGMTRFLVDGAAPVRLGDYPVAHYRVVSPNYFEAMGIPLVKGRVLEEADITRTDAGVMVINRTLAREFFPGQDPVGRNIELGVTTGRLNKIPIVGVVGDVRDLAIETPAPPEMYFAGFNSYAALMVRTARELSSMVRGIRDTVLSVDPSQPVYQVRTGEELLDDSIARQRFSAALLGAFSFLALILAAGGIYGVTAYGVSTRTREIGVRMALGAQPRDVLRLVLRQEMLGIDVGLAAGIVASLAATKLLAGLLYGVSSSDPITYAGVAMLLGAAAFCACYVPARRAMRVDPMVALRYE